MQTKGAEDQRFWFVDKREHPRAPDPLEELHFLLRHGPDSSRSLEVTRLQTLQVLAKIESQTSKLPGAPDFVPARCKMR